MSKKALEHTEPWHKANYFSDKLYFMGSVKVNNTQGDGDKCRGVTNFAACFTNIPWGLTWEGPKQTDQKLHRAKQHLGPAVCIRASFRFVDPPPRFFLFFSVFGCLQHSASFSFAFIFDLASGEVAAGLLSPDRPVKLDKHSPPPVSREWPPFERTSMFVKKGVG